MTTALEVFSDLSERLRYNLPDFPLYVRQGLLRQFDGYAAACHWHPDLEFVSMLEGSMSYFVNGRVELLRQGEGIFVNSQRLHYGFSAAGTDSLFLVVAVHPSLLADSNPTVKPYLQEKFGSDSQDSIVLRPENPWQNEILDTLPALYRAMEGRESPPFLRLLAWALSVCAGVGEHLEPKSSPELGDKSWMAVWRMRSFIHRSYGSDISLDDIAASGAVCRSRCCQLFARQVGQSPNAYLNGYRIRRSCEMLLETKRTVAEIALACGFRSPSYFAAAFRSEMGIAPSAYRAQDS